MLSVSDRLRRIYTFGHNFFALKYVVQGLKLHRKSNSTCRGNVTEMLERKIPCVSIYMYIQHILCNIYLSVCNKF